MHFAGKEQDRGRERERDRERERESDREERKRGLSLARKGLWYRSYWSSLQGLRKGKILGVDLQAYQDGN